MDVPTRRMCPGCDSAMFTFDVEGVELDRCTFCGGVWFDRGELEAVAGRALPVEPLEGHTTRRCVYCKLSLNTALIGSVPVEVCGACMGGYLDDGELVELASREIAWRRTGQARGTPAENRVDFRCPGCGERFDVSVGLATSSGLVCGPCYGPLQAGTQGPSPMALTMQERLQLEAADVVAGQVLPPGIGSLLWLGWRTFIRG